MPFSPLPHHSRSFASAALISLISATLTASAADVSLRNEVQHSIDRGIQWLSANQNTNGWWSTADHPAVTALALTAWQASPSTDHAQAGPAGIGKGYSFLLGCAKPDGGIYVKDLANYNTSISMMALLAARNPEYDSILRKSRAYLVGSQVDLGEKGKLDSPFDGGIGYGSHYQHSDLNNTLVALEALHYSKHLIQDKNLPDNKDLDWNAAIQFLQNCQNLKAYNPQDWADDSDQNKGGFIYYPGQSMAGGVTNATTGRVAFRSYGSASYSGLLSYIYTDLKPGDPRVVAVMQWLRKNYTLDENPGMGPAGLYYYLQTMTKALSTAHIDEFELADGRRINWRKEVALKLMNLQARDGSWANETARWWEKDPALVTSYSLIALETIYRSL